MFTGIIAEQGKVLSVERNGDSSATVRLHAPGTTDGLALGGSIAVNGVCLTATQIDGRDFSVDVMGETLVRSTIGELTAGDPVNLERCVPAGGRLDGHVVQGHVDGVGQLWSARGLATGTGCGSRAGRAGPVHRRKGIHRRRRRLPHRHGSQPGRRSRRRGSKWGSSRPPWPRPAWARRQPAARVNLEVDVLAKYTERLLAFAGGSPPTGTGHRRSAEKRPHGRGPKCSRGHGQPGMTRPGCSAPRCRHRAVQASIRSRTPSAPWQPAGPSWWWTTRTAKTKATSFSPPSTPPPR